MTIKQLLHTGAKYFMKTHLQILIIYYIYLNLLKYIPGIFQWPKVSVEAEDFQSSAFGFGLQSLRSNIQPKGFS